MCKTLPDVAREKLRNYSIKQQKVKEKAGFGDESVEFIIDRKVCVQFGIKQRSEVGRLKTHDGDFVNPWASIFIYEDKLTRCGYYTEDGMHFSDGSNCLDTHIINREAVVILDWDHDITV